MVTIFSFLIISISTFANDQSDAKPLLCATITECNAMLETSRENIENLLTALENDTIKTSSFEASKEDMHANYMNVQTSKYKRDIEFHQIQVAAFQEQAKSTKSQLTVISILMVAGLVFAGVQLGFAVKYGRQVDGSENSIQLGELSFKSSVMGITILFIWLIAYFIYVERIYPIDTIEVINEIQNPPDNQKQASGPVD